MTREYLIIFQADGRDITKGGSSFNSCDPNATEHRKKTFDQSQRLAPNRVSCTSILTAATAPPRCWRFVPPLSRPRLAVPFDDSEDAPIKRPPRCCPWRCPCREEAVDDDDVFLLPLPPLPSPPSVGLTSAVAVARQASCKNATTPVSCLKGRFNNKRGRVKGWALR